MPRYIYTTSYIKRIDNSKSKMKRRQIREEFAKSKERFINHSSSDIDSWQTVWSHSYLRT